MEPSLWGPKCWYTLHSIALNYPDKPTQEDQNNYRTFFKNLGNVLPCDNCKIHYSQNLVEEELNSALISKKALFNWTVSLHNKVNKMNGKKEYSYEEALESLENGYTSFFDYKLLIIILLLLYIIKK
jgi:FAD-linked sulfhydryl oxidase